MANLISHIEIRHLSRLAQLQLSDPEEIKHLVADLNQLLEMFKILNSTNVDNITPLSSPIELSQPLRPDNPEQSISPDKLLSCASELNDSSYTVPRVISTDS